MHKYRLTWQGEGSLDLSQLLDERGQPVVLVRKGAAAIVDEITATHPLVQHYMKTDLDCEKLGGLQTTSITPTPKAPPPVPKKKKPPISNTEPLATLETQEEPKEESEEEPKRPPSFENKQPEKPKETKTRRTKKRSLRSNTDDDE